MAVVRMHVDTFTFRVTCADKADPEDLCQNLKEYPEMFVENLLVCYSLETQRSSKRTISIRAEHAQGGQMFTELQQRFPKDGVVFMSSDDAKKLTMEVATRVLATEITDDEFAGQDQSLTISNLLKTALDIQAVSSETFTPEMWSSVFWHDNNSRPDMVTQELNEVYDKSDSSQKALIRTEAAGTSKSVQDSSSSNEVSSDHSGGSKNAAARSNSSKNTNNTSVKTGGSGWGIEANVEVSHKRSAEAAKSYSNSNENNYAKQDSSASSGADHALAESSFQNKAEHDKLTSLLHDAKRVAQWNGTKFIPKSMQLSRVNMSVLKSSTTIVTAQLSVTRTTSELTSRINVVESGSHAPEINEQPIPNNARPSPAPIRRYIQEVIANGSVLNVGTPSLYQSGLKVTEKDNRNASRLRKFTILPVPKSDGAPSKVILVLGATGAGKTTLINAMMQYFFNVEWEDSARLKVILEEGEATSQASSMTKWVSAYTVYQQFDSPSPYSLTVIDTPGFGDTEGLKRDREITEQLKQLFSGGTSNFKGIDQIDAVCIVVQSSLARLTATQRYIFDCILSIFGKDIEENIFLLCTFADDKDPPVLAAVKDAKLPYRKWFPFNNCALFANNGPDAGMFSKLYWEMGTKSMSEFFKYLGQLTPQSLVLTREVLKERTCLEATVNGLQPQITKGLAKMEEIRQIQDQILGHGKKITDKSNFTMTIGEPFANQIMLDNGVYVTNCLTCNATCHFPCGIPNDNDKSGCDAMTNGKCHVCPRQCPWNMHYNNEYRFEVGTRRVQRTLDNVKQEYEEAKGQKLTAEQLLSTMQQRLDEVATAVTRLIFQTTEHLNRLDQIALRPNVMSTTEYVEILIESEQAQQRPGYHQRVNALQDAKKRAKVIEQVRANEDKNRGGVRQAWANPKGWFTDFSWS